MNCEKCEKLLVDYLYQELSAPKMIEVEKHLQQCRRCARTLESWQTIHTGYQKTASDEEASPFLKQRILMAAKEQLSKEPSRIQSLLAVLRPVVVLPVILVSLVALLYLQFIAPQRKEMAVNKLEAPKPQAIPEQRESQVRDNRELEAQKLDDLKSLGYVGSDEKRRADEPVARRKTAPAPVPDAASTPAESSLYDLQKDAESDRAQAEPPAAAAPLPEAPPPPASEAPPSANEDAYSRRGEAKQEQLGLGQKAAKAAGLTGVSNLQIAQQKFSEDNLKDGQHYAEIAVEEDRTGSLASEIHSMGIRSQANKEYDKAILQFELVAGNYRSYAYMQDVLLRLAASYTELGQFEKARAVYQRLLQISPSNKEALDHLNELNKKDKAKRQLKTLETEKKQD